MVFGVKPGATSFFDSWCDVPKTPEPQSPYVYAYFYYSADPDVKNLYASYIAPAVSESWDVFRVKYVNDDDPDTPIDITLSWNISDFPASSSVSLYQGASLVANMKAVDNYTYSTAAGITTFKIGVVSRPELISPTPGSTVSPTPTFEWTSVSDPSGVTYTIQVDNDPDFFSPEVDVAGLTDNTYTSSALADGTYYWHVQAVDGVGNVGDWSGEWNFTVVPMGAVGVLLMPLLLLLPFALLLRRQNRRYS